MAMLLPKITDDVNPTLTTLLPNLALTKAVRYPSPFQWIFLLGLDHDSFSPAWR